MGPIYYHVQTASIGINLGCTQAWFGSGVNSFIHVLMYSYYLITGFGVQVPWFRMPLTIMQLLQFYAAFTHAICNLYYRHVEGQNWPLPTTAGFIEAGTTVLMMVMFTDFFIKSYCGGQAKPSKTKSS
jgi:elongation of very long chain fatty acids protein 4